MEQLLACITFVMRAATVPREPVKKSSYLLKATSKRLRTGEEVEIVNHGTPPQIEEILADAPIAGASALPSANLCECMLHRDPFAQLLAALRRLLPLA